MKLFHFVAATVVATMLVFGCSGQQTSNTAAQTAQPTAEMAEKAASAQPETAATSPITGIVSAYLELKTLSPPTKPPMTPPQERLWSPR